MIVGLGIDVVSVARMAAALERAPRLAERLFTPTERERPLQSLAGCFAAKEAAFKALGGQTLRWQEVEVVRAESGAPGLRLTGRAKELADALGADRIHVSVSHDAGAAAAVVVLESA